MRTFYLASRVLCPALLLFAGCSGFDLSGADCNFNHTCNGADAGAGDAGGGVEAGGDGAAPEDGGSDAGGDGAVGCEAGVDPKDSAGCVTEEHGVFVDGVRGNDANAGTKGAPVKSIGAAIGKTGVVKSVFVCAGGYVEASTLLLDAGHDGVGIYGGWSCDDWSYSGGATKVSVGSGYVLRVDGVKQGATIEDVELDAPAGAEGSVNSVATLATGSQGVIFKRVKFVARDGYRGGDGATGSNYTDIAQNNVSIRGKDTANETGGGPHTCSLCANGVNSTGGAGGSGTEAPTDGQDGAPTITDAGAPKDGKKGIGGASCGGDGTGHDGADGLSASAAPGAAKLGTLTSAGWTPEPGSAGAAGGVGQGGGGGGGGKLAGGGGAGGGGCGGCGGAGGTAPTGGGASIGLLVVESVVSVSASVIQTGKGGDGGAGKAGQGGQGGGFGGIQSAPGCPGGAGGTGGTGGASGGGAGGISIGILYKSATEPTVDDATKNNISAGGAGAQGAGGAGVSNAGKPGVSAAGVKDVATL